MQRCCWVAVACAAWAAPAVALQLPSLQLRRAPAAPAPSRPFADGGWRFEGRFLFAPQLVRAPAATPGGTRPLALFGWTLGGVVALDYDDSPVGAYREFVEMGAAVAKGGTAGQWGARLSVSTRRAAAICRDVWRVPAETAAIDYADDGAALAVAGGPGRYAVAGWGRTRLGGARRSPALPVAWTPEVKALWAPVGARARAGLAVHDLRLSATSLAVRRFVDDRPDPSGRRVPLGFCLAADGLRIDIAPHRGAFL